MKKCRQPWNVIFSRSFMPDCAATSRKSSSHTLFSRGLTGGPTALPSGLPRPLRYRPSGGAEWNVVVVFAFGEPRHKSRWAPIQSPAHAGLLELASMLRHPASVFQPACRPCRRHPWRLFAAFARRASRFKSRWPLYKEPAPPRRRNGFFMGPPGLEPGTDGL